jgi:hypothetical protein
VPNSYHRGNVTSHRAVLSSPDDVVRKPCRNVFLAQASECCRYRGAADSTSKCAEATGFLHQAKNKTGRELLGHTASMKASSTNTRAYLSVLLDQANPYTKLSLPAWVSRRTHTCANMGQGSEAFRCFEQGNHVAILASVALGKRPRSFPTLVRVHVLCEETRHPT